MPHVETRSFPSGLDAAMKLADALGDRFFLNNAGHVLTLTFDDSRR